jgi:hypothetical protein
MVIHSMKKDKLSSFKKGQANPQQWIALFIFLVMFLLILYILFLPPEDRADLLEQNRTNIDGSKVKDKVTILMTKEPGRLTNIAETEIINDIPSFSLFTRTDATSLVEFDSIYIRKSLFEEQLGNISFDLPTFEDIDNFILSFTASKREGILTVTLNDLIILSRELSTSSPSPIKIPKDYLNNHNNLVFSISGPGVEFWKQNEYVLENLKITADVTDKSSQDNTQIIYVTEKEKENIESFELRFIADCRSLDVDPLEIYLRKRKIYDSVPDCGDVTKLPPIDGSRLVQGENDLVFRTDNGNYLLYSVETKMNLKEPLFPTYFFIVDQQEFKDIETNDADINISILFSNDVDRKKGEVFINDYIIEIETYESYYNRKINQFIRDGNNAVEVRPVSDKLDITELRMLLIE